MNTDSPHIKGRDLKRMLHDLLRQSGPEKALETFHHLPARQVVNPLFSFLYSTEPLLKWHAISAMGILVSTLIQTNVESGRTILRRLMWNLNDESGGIGWGSVEAMGEILARSASMAKEYAAILSSYIQPAGNFLETEGLQEGALWAIGRVAHEFPALISSTAPFLLPFMISAHPVHRGLSAWAAGPMQSEITKPHLTELTRDTRIIDIFMDGSMVKRHISALAKASLQQLRNE